jgi:hypothetical protein
MGKNGDVAVYFPRTYQFGRRDPAGNITLLTPPSGRAFYGGNERAVNGNGDILTYSEDPIGSGQHTGFLPLLWKKSGESVPIPVPFSFPVSINDADIVVGSATSLGKEGGGSAYAWDPSTNNVRSLNDTLSVSNNTEAVKINNQSLVIGFAILKDGPAPYRTFLWNLQTNDVKIPIYDDGNGWRHFVTQLTDINDGGLVTGYVDDGSSTTTAFVWDTTKDPLGTNMSYIIRSATAITSPAGWAHIVPLHINAGGQVVGEAYNNEVDDSVDGIPRGNAHKHAFFWDPVSGFHDLAPLLPAGTTYSSAIGINARGQVLGLAENVMMNQDIGTFVYDSLSNTMQIIDPPAGIDRFDGKYIDDAGNVVGSAWFHFDKNVHERLQASEDYTWDPVTSKMTRLGDPPGTPLPTNSRYLFNQ